MQHINGVMEVFGCKLNYDLDRCNENSVYGLKGGKIRKLLIHYKSFEACKYSRGVWEKEPVDIISYEAMIRILGRYN